MTANGDSASADKEAPNGEATRRQFLGAAAALSALPVVDETSSGNVSTTGEGPLAPTKNGFDKDDYGAKTISQSAGHMEVWPPDPEPVEVTVRSAVECVGLRLSTNSGHIQASMLPEDVEKLIEELQRAKAKTIEAEVEWAREWEVHQE